LAQLEEASKVNTQDQLNTSWIKRILSGRRGRNLREYITGYAFILPSITLIFTFGLFPHTERLDIPGYDSALDTHSQRSRFDLQLNRDGKLHDNVMYIHGSLVDHGEQVLESISRFNTLWGI
jgi:hypothetical protein